MIKFLYYSLCFYFFIGSLELKPNQWYSQEVTAFSNFRNIPHTDYSTNALVHQWYCKQPVKYFRMNKPFIDELLKEQDTITVSVDYYGLFPLCGLQDLVIKLKAQQFLLEGNVFIIKYYRGKIFY